MRRIDTDVAIIGAGTAGLAAYRAARAAGRRAVIIEGGAYGTTCARVGCMPSKLLIAAAEAAHGPARWAEFGLALQGKVRVDGRAVMARVRRERDRFVGFVLAGVDAIPAEDRLRGYGRFTGPQSLAVDGGVHAGTEVFFSRAVIATGSSPVVPGVLRGAGDRVIVNDDVFGWEELPRSVAVVGPGVIGLELGQALARLGVEVRMYGMGGVVGPFADPALRAYAARTFGAEFFLDADARLTATEREGDRVRLRTTAVPEGVLIDYVIAATGRAPNLRGLALELTGVELDARGVPVYDPATLQCGDRPIFIAGDANADLPLLHEAADEGCIAGENAARFPSVQQALRRAPLAVVFSDPQIAVVGQRRGSLREESIVTGVASFENQGRSRVMLRNKGLAHVYADAATGRLLGAEMIGPDAEHLGHLVAWAVQLGLTVSAVLALPFYHPVVEEGLRTALRDAQAKLDARALRRAA